MFSSLISLTQFYYCVYCTIIEKKILDPIKLHAE